MNKIRTRFAPSPTGYLHIGGVRMALYDYLIAKKNNGQMILRIEDTDKSREVDGAKEKLYEILDWLGFEFDESPVKGGDYGPYIQSERTEIYKKHIDELLGKGEAYHCFCSAERLKEMREDQQAQKLPPRYDRKCRDLKKEDVEKKIKAGESFVIRQKMPLNGEIVVNDELRGEIKFKAEELEDHVLLKTDGTPTYQFANVIDDHLMEISHVVRGSEWIPSFPKNILLYIAFGWKPPKFIHTALTLNKDGGKLSKRQGDVSVEDYREKGYLPEAILNFNALLGWHTKDDNEIFSLKDMVEKFEIKDMGTSGAIFDIEKLDYFNGYYIRQKNINELVELCRPYLEENLKLTKNNNKKSDEFIKKVVALEQERLKKLSEIGELTKFFFVDKLDYPEDLLSWKKLTVDQAKENLKIIIELLEKIPEENWTNDSIEDAIITYLNSKELKIGEYLWPMRVALSGEKASPSPFDIADVLGKAESIKRVKQII